jgi:hypothetical protein
LTQQPNALTQQPNAPAAHARSGSSVPAHLPAQPKSRAAAHPPVVHHTPSVRPNTARSSVSGSKADDRDRDSTDQEFDGPSRRDNRGDRTIDGPNGLPEPDGLLDGLTNSLGGGLLGLG